MIIQAGQPIPHATLKTIAEGFPDTDSESVFKGRKVVLFAVPGAFTPTCSNRHLPGFVEHMQDFRDRGVTVACLSVNDAFVMSAWAKSQNVPEDLVMLADGNGELTQALGLVMDGQAYGMGMRAKRFALYVDDGVVKQVHVEAPGEFRVSSAEAMLASIA